MIDEYRSLNEITDEGPPVMPGDVFVTNYGTGPYEVLSVDGPCTCLSYLDYISNRNIPLIIISLAKEGFILMDIVKLTMKS